MRAFVIFLSFSLNLLASVDVTSKVEILGNPYSELYKSGGYIYARNIWDMQVFSGKLYIGAGNSNNKGPAPNAEHRGQVMLMLSNLILYFYKEVLNGKTTTYRDSRILPGIGITSYPLIANCWHTPHNAHSQDV